MLARLSLED